MALKPTKIKSIQADWRTGHYSLGDIAKKYKISKATAHRHCNKSERGKTSQLVETIHKADVIKRNENETDIRAAEQVSKRLQKHQQQKDSIVDMALTGTQKNLAFATVQAGDKKTVPSDRASLQRVFKTGLDMVTEKKDKPIIENNLNVAQLMQHDENRTTVVTAEHIKEMDPAQLAEYFNKRNLPIVDESTVKKVLQEFDDEY